MTNTRSTTLTPDHFRCLTEMLEAAATLCAEDALALFQEGHLKAALVARLLRSGHTVREGSHTNNEDWLLSSVDGVLRTEAVPRPPRLKGDGSRDIRVENPSLHVELKCFGEFGAKDFFERGEQGLGGDLGRVRDGVADAAIVAVAGKHYDGARGDKHDARGRKPKVESVFAELLPAREAIPEDAFRAFRGQHAGVDYVLFARRVAAPAGVNGTGHRIIVALVRADRAAHVAGA